MVQGAARLQGELGNLVQILVDGLERQLSEYGFDAVQYTILSVCESAGPISIKELKKLVPIDSGHMSRTTNHLEDKGLIEKTRTSHDRRLVNLRVTEQALALMPELKSRVQEYYAHLVRDIGHEELIGCVAMMQRIIAAGEEAEDHPAPPVHLSESSSNPGEGGAGMAGQPQSPSNEAHIATLQSDVTTLVNVMYRGIEEKVSPFELTVGEYSVFTTCFINQPITISGLAKRVPVGAGRVSRIVSRLEDRDLIRKVRPAGNRRVVIAEVTDKGHALALELMGSVGEHYANILRRVSEQELTDLLGFIERMTANAESRNGRSWGQPRLKRQPRQGLTLSPERLSGHAEVYKVAEAAGAGAAPYRV